MAEYLQPFSNELSLEQKREMFSIRNRMNNIPENFPKRDEKYKCICGQIEKITHIYDCEILSKNKQQRVPYEKIFNGNINEQIEVFKLVKQNLEKREMMKSETDFPCDPSGSAVLSNG